MILISFIKPCVLICLRLLMVAGWTKIEESAEICKCMRSHYNYQKGSNPCTSKWGWSPQSAQRALEDCLRLFLTSHFSFGGLLSLFVVFCFFFFLRRSCFSAQLKRVFHLSFFFCSPFSLPGMMERLCLLRYSINFIEGRASFFGNQSFGNLAAFMVSALYFFWSERCLQKAWVSSDCCVIPAVSTVCLN